MSIETMFVQQGDLAEWMCLVDLVADDFPGLDKEEYQRTLEDCIRRREAICARENGRIAGVLLFSVEHSVLAFMAVHPAFRRRGVAAGLIDAMAAAFQPGQDIWGTTYRQDDPKGVAARALYERYGFFPNELVAELGYPCQKFVLQR